MTITFLGMPPPNIKQWIVEHTTQANDKLKLVVQTTSNNKKSGIYSAQRDDTTKPVVIDWGDGTVEQVNGDVSQKVHEYATEGEFEASISNVKTFAAGANNSTWHNTTSQNRYTLKEVVFGSSVTSIGDYAFYNCGSLTSVTIPDSVTSIWDCAFYGCSDLTSVTIPDSVTSIGPSAFSGCSGLTSVTIPNSVTTIRVSAFEGCSGLTSVTIPSSVTSIMDSVFFNCSSLTSVTIGNGVTSISEGAFAWCGGMMAFTVVNGNQSYKSVSGLLLTKDGKTLIAGVNGNVTIPDSVTSIGHSAFSGRTGLTSVTIPNSVTSIEPYAFDSCSGLTSVTIPNSVTSIEPYAFDSCSGLTSVTIPSSVENIGEYAFSICSGLTGVIFQGFLFDKFSTKSMIIDNYIFGDVFYDPDTGDSIEKTFNVTCIDGSFNVTFGIDYSITFTDL